MEGIPPFLILGIRNGGNTSISYFRDIIAYLVTSPAIVMFRTSKLSEVRRVGAGAVSSPRSCCHSTCGGTRERPTVTSKLNSR